MADKKAASSKSKTTIKTTASAVEKKTLATKIKSCGHSLKRKPLTVRVIAEFIGTFLLTVAFLEMQSNPLYVAFAVIGIVLIVGGVSGAHLNPAVTIGAWITGKIKGTDATCYIVSQLLGAGAGLAVVNGFATAIATDSSTSTLFHAATISGNEWFLFLAEVLGTFILSLGFAYAIRNRKNKVTASVVAGLATMIGLYVAMSITTSLITEYYVGYTFLNPALAMAAQGLSFAWWPIAIFIIAPILGSVIGFVVQDILHTQDETAIQE